MAQFRPQNQIKPDIKHGDDNEYMRTQTNLVKNNGDTSSGKYMVDPRLPLKFKFHFGGQMGWVVIPKGRIVSIDPAKERKAFDDNKYYNMITISNGGEDVEEVNDDPKDREEEGEEYVRVANKPVGVSHLNVYQDRDNEFAGNPPGFITRNMIELPYFEAKEDAEDTEWGSCYGADLKAGDKVKSDENGRFIKWQETGLEKEEVFEEDADQTEFQLDYAIEGAVVVEVEQNDESWEEVSSDDYAVAKPAGKVTLDSAPSGDESVDDTNDVRITYESQDGDSVEQIVGQVVKIDTNMVPAGWLKWVAPESDYLDPTGFNAEDLMDFDGFPYDPQYMEGYGDGSLRATGIPGLTDGSNVIVPYEDKPIGEINITEDYTNDETLHFNLRVLPENTPILKDTLEIEIDGETYDKDDDIIRRIDADVGLIMLEVNKDNTTGSDLSEQEYEVTADFSAKHQLPGMPSNIDFEGVAGSVDILLQL